MRKILIAILAATGIGVFNPSEAPAAPASGAGIAAAVEAASMVQDARLFCYNRRSGRFLHWGSCWR